MGGFNNYPGFNSSSSVGAIAGSYTLTEIQNKISASTLDPGAFYGIITPTYGGTIYLVALSNNTFDPNGLWIRNTSIRSFGWIRLTGGASGSVDTITVNGVNIMTASVAFDTSLTVTATNVAANITANSATSGWEAIGCGDVVVLIAISDGTANNGLTVSGTATTITLGNTQNTTKGEATRVIGLEVSYIVSTDRISACYDPVYHNRINTATTSANSVKRITNFRWGDAAFNSNFTNNSDFFDNFAITTGAIQANTIFGNSAKMTKNVCAANNYISDNTVQGNGSVQDNVLFGVFAVATPQISKNIVANFLSGNVFLGNGPTIYGNKLLSNNPTSGGITNNILTGTGAPQIQYNTITGTGASISSNILSGVLSYINDNNLLGRSSAINSNDFGSGGNEKGIRGNLLQGNGSAINSNVFNFTTNDSGIQFNNLLGNGSTISSNTMNAVSGSIRGGIFYNTFSGFNSGFNSNTTVQDIFNIILAAENAKFENINFTSLSVRFDNIEWRNDNRLFYNIIKTGLSGASGNGLSGSNILLSILPVAKIYPVRAIFEGSGLTGATAQLQVGIETDDTDCVMQATAITGLNQVVNPTAGLTPSKTTAAGRHIVAVPSVANITSGSLQISVEFGVSAF